MLDPNPSTRITLVQAMLHPYFKDFDFEACASTSTPSALFPLPSLLPPSPPYDDHYQYNDDEGRGRLGGLSFRTFWCAKGEKGDGELVRMGKRMDEMEGGGVYEWVCSWGRLQPEGGMSGSGRCGEEEEVDENSLTDGDQYVDLPEIVIDEDEVF